MTLHDTALRRQPDNPATPVARLDALPELQAWCVTALRHWMEGPATQTALRRDLACSHGVAGGRAILRDLDSLLDLICRDGRRQMMRRHVGCAAVAADEAVFAQFVATAATGQREDALLMAMLIVRPDLAPLAASLGQRLGLAYLRHAPGGIHRIH